MKKAPNKKIATVALAGILALGAFSVTPSYACADKPGCAKKQCAKKQCAKKVKKECCKKKTCNKAGGCKRKSSAHHSNNARYND